MKVIALVALLLHVGSVQALPFFGTSSSSETSAHSADYLSSCLSSGNYNQLQQDVAAGLWSYDEKDPVNSVNTHLNEYPAFQIIVSFNFSDGGLPDVHYTLSTEVLKGVKPGICISSATDGRQGMLRSLKDTVSSWIWDIESTSSSTAEAPLLEVLKVERILSIGQQFNELWNRMMAGTGTPSLIIRLLKFMESIKRVVSGSTAEFVIHVIPPFPETVMKDGPVLEGTINEMKTAHLRREVKNAIVFNELLSRVVVPQLLLETAPVLSHYSYADVLLPLNIRKTGIIGLKKLINNAVLPTLGNHISGNTEFMTELFAPMLENDVVTDVTEFMVGTVSSIGDVVASVFPFVTPARLGLSLLSVFL